MRALALDKYERSPPSSIVARCDTAEALELAHVADKATLESEQALSANNLWSVVVGFLTVSPDDYTKAHRDSGAGEHVVSARTERTARLGSCFWRIGQSVGAQVAVSLLEQS